MKFNEKDYEYFDYIVEHKRNLMKAFDLLIKAEGYCNSCHGGDLALITKEEFKVLRDNILNHDLSKFSSEEFYDYRKQFFPIDEKEKSDANFKDAWEHHYKNNPHHPEFHNEKMSKMQMLEMCLDWVAMSLKFKDNPLAYFKEKRKKLEIEFEEKIDYEYVLMILANINVVYKF